MFRPAVAVVLLASTACLAAIRSPTDAGSSTVDTGTPAADSGVDTGADSPPQDASTADADIADTGGPAPDAQPAADTGFADAQVPTGQPRYIFVGDGGSWASSSDGNAWTQQAPSTVYEDLLRDVTYGGGRFFAVGGGGNTSVVQVSTDGTNWTRRNSPDGWIGAVAWLPTTDILVIAGSNGLRYRSINGGDTFVDEAGFLEGHFRDAVYGNGRVVAVGDTYGAQGGRGLSGTTVDGRAWSTSVTGSSVFWSVTYGESVQTFVAGGEDGRVSWSTDGQNWTDQTLGNARVHVVYGGDRFIALASNGAHESTDGRSWTSIGNIPVFRLVYGDGRWVGVDVNAETYTSANGRQWTSTAGTGVPSTSAVFGWANP